MRHRTFWCAILSVILTAGGGCVIHGDGGWRGGRKISRRTVELAEPAGEVKAFRVEGNFGDISVRGADTEECRVKAIISGFSFTAAQAESLVTATAVSLVRQGATLAMEIDRPEFQEQEYVKVELDVTVPRTVVADLHAMIGDVRITDLDAAATGRTDSGPVVVERIRGDVTASANVGSITLRDVKARQIDLKTNSGSINGEIRFESLRATMNIGGIEIVCLPGSEAKDIQLSTNSGSIRLKLPPDYSAQVEASTNSGKIRTDLPLTVRGTMSQTLNGTIGSGEGRLSLRTSIGSIELR